VDITGLGSESVVMTSCDSLSVMRGPKCNADICPSDWENAKKIGQFTHIQTLCNINVIYDSMQEGECAFHTLGLE
jgi:hypothetical protein